MSLFRISFGDLKCLIHMQVFFPMLSRLLDGDDMMDAFSLEETRMRGAQLLNKVSSS